jgi:FixJ family two-component response regulator
MVFVIDDDESVRKALKRLLGASGYENEGFESAAEFLMRPEHPGPSCLLVDVQMPGLSGIELQETLRQHQRDEQLVFITGHGNVPMCAQAMKAGAVDFLPKPFKTRELLQCIERALARSAESRRSAAEKKEAQQLLDSLTPREFQVMRLLTAGMLNKEVGAELGLAVKTVKVHRGRVTHKLGVHSVIEMVRLSEKAEVAPYQKKSYAQGPISAASPAG